MPPGPDAGLATRDGAFAMCQVVTGGPDGEVCTTLSVRDGRAPWPPGDADADVTIRLTWDDAVAMAAGALAPGDAIAAGRMRVRGDLSVLAEAQAGAGAPWHRISRPCGRAPSTEAPARVEARARD